MDTSPPAAAPPSSPTPAPVPVPDTASVTQPTPPVTTPAATTPPVAGPAFGDLSTFLSGEALQSAINNMTEMGFPREQVLRAMRASYNNADRAVEYLMTVRFVTGCLTNSTNELLGDSRPFGGGGC
jgi:UV excision repair protein RAD23